MVCRNPLICISSQYDSTGALLYTSRAEFYLGVTEVELGAAIPIGGIVGIILAILLIFLLCILLLCCLCPSCLFYR